MNGAYRMGMKFLNEALGNHFWKELKRWNRRFLSLSTAFPEKEIKKIVFFCKQNWCIDTKNNKKRNIKLTCTVFVFVVVVVVVVLFV